MGRGGYFALLKETLVCAKLNGEAQDSPPVSASPWRVAAAAVRGVSHIRQGLPCQDALGYQILENGTLLAVVADGAGSAERADDGAQAAATVMIETLAAELAEATPASADGWQTAMENAFAQARLALECIAEQMELPLAAFAATLTCAVVTPTWLTWGHLGDGALVCGPSASALLTVTRPQRGEYANETCFLTQPDALDQVQVYALDFQIRALALMSDGLLRLGLRLPSLAPHMPFFEPLFDFATHTEDSEEAKSQLAAFLASERVNERTDDDKSLILAVRRDVTREETTGGESSE